MATVQTKPQQQQCDSTTVALDFERLLDPDDGAFYFGTDGLWHPREEVRSRIFCHPDGRAFVPVRLPAHFDAALNDHLATLSIADAFTLLDDGVAPVMALARMRIVVYDVDRDRLTGTAIAWSLDMATTIAGAMNCEQAEALGHLLAGPVPRERALNAVDLHPAWLKLCDKYEDVYRFSTPHFLNDLFRQLNIFAMLVGEDVDSPDLLPGVHGTNVCLSTCTGLSSIDAGYFSYDGLRDEVALIRRLINRIRVKHEAAAAQAIDPAELTIAEAFDWQIAPSRKVTAPAGKRQSRKATKAEVEREFAAQLLNHEQRERLLVMSVRELAEHFDTHKGTVERSEAYKQLQAARGPAHRGRTIANPGDEYLTDSNSPSAQQGYQRVSRR